MKTNATTNVIWKAVEIHHCSPRTQGEVCPSDYHQSAPQPHKSMQMEKSVPFQIKNHASLSAKQRHIRRNVLLSDGGGASAFIYTKR
mmetsp:Transcript_1990/g.5664  ORF Transcript_1990/g.5664 Transcript_1990/m.5664 type:complete len:87 (-) Transcript_1990:142-402(-)